jgi:hypothetical protein
LKCSGYVYDWCNIIRGICYQCAWRWACMLVWHNNLSKHFSLCSEAGTLAYHKNIVHKQEWKSSYKDIVLQAQIIVVKYYNNVLYTWSILKKNTKYSLRWMTVIKSILGIQTNIYIYSVVWLNVYLVWRKKFKQTWKVEWKTNICRLLG